jgi:hypothetical protein
MKALSFYLLLTTMALMETVSAQFFTIPPIIFFNQAGKMSGGADFERCFNVANVAKVFYYDPAICQYYTDKTCKTSTSDPPVAHAARDKAPPKNPTGFVKCLPTKK